MVTLYSFLACLNDASDSCLIPGVEDGARSDGTLSEQYCRKCDLKITKSLKPASTVVPILG